MKQLTLWQRAAVALTDGLMLLLGLYGTLFSFLTAFSLTLDTGALLRLLLILTAAALLVFSLPKPVYRLALSLVWLLVLGWFVYEEFSTLYVGALSAAEQVGGIFAARIGLGLTGPDFSEQLGSLGLADQWQALTLLVSGLLALLALGLGWVVVERRSFWLSFGLTFPILLVPLTITVTPGYLPLAALLLFWAAGLLSRLVAKADPWGSSKLTMLTLPLAALLLAAVAVLPRNYYESAKWVGAARMAALDRLSGAGRSILASGNLSGLTMAGTEVDLRKAGPLRFTGSTVLRVESEITGHIYLRGFSAGTYTATGWKQLDDALYASHTSQQLLLSKQNSDQNSGQAEGPTGFNPLNFPALLFHLGPSRRFTVESLGLASGHVYTPYNLSTTPENMKGAEFVHDSYLARSPGIRRYVLYAETEALPEDDARQEGEAAMAEQTYRDFVYQAYRDVPPTLSPVLDNFLSGFSQEVIWRAFEDVGTDLPGPAALAGIIARLLAMDSEYDPDTPHTPAGEDFVEYFLTTSKRGYCMHYASAATLLLRQAGIPARYVTGYTADVKAGQTVSVPDENAHAWVEVYLDGYGWYPVEVTPGFSGQTAASQPTPSPTPSARPTPSAEPTPSRAPNTPAPQPKQEEHKGLRWDDLAPYVLTLAALVLAVLLLRLRRQLAQRLRARRFGGADTNRAVIAMYLYAGRLLRHGVGGELSPDAELLGQKAKFSRHILTGEERGGMAAYVADLAKHTDEALPRWRRLALRYFWGLC